METVTIICTHPGGLRLTVPGRENVFVAGATRSGFEVHAKPGRTPVDAEHWRQWRALHAENPVVLSGSIYALPTTATTEG